MSTLVNVLISVVALETRWTGAGSLSCHLVSVTAGPWLARIDVALVIQVTQEASLACWTLALIFANLVNTRSSIVARLGSTVIFVHLTVSASVAVDTDTFVSSLRVSASAMVLTWVVESTLIHVVKAVVSGPVVSTLTRVGVDAIHTRPSVVTNTIDTIVNVHLTVGSSES